MNILFGLNAMGWVLIFLSMLSNVERHITRKFDYNIAPFGVDY